MQRIQFQQLWKSHPGTQGIELPCKTENGAPTYQNQCAVRMSIALAAAGVNMNHYHKARCHQKGHPVHAVRAQELADWLSLPAQLGHPKKFKKNKMSEDAFGGMMQFEVMGKNGIVFFKNFWGRHNQGDHIDVWKFDQMAYGDNSDFGRSQEVWFWELKV